MIVILVLIFPFLGEKMLQCVLTKKKKGSLEVADGQHLLVVYPSELLDEDLEPIYSISKTV